MAQGASEPPGYRLAIGDKNYSSWSLRPWLAMRAFGIPFDEIDVVLRSPNRRANILAQSPSGLVPVLKAGALTIWDTLAILEYLAEAHPELPMWPGPRDARAVARSVSAEMHAGFRPLREAMPMDFVSIAPAADVPQPVADDIRRIVAIWRDCRCRFGAGGPFLFGAFSIADAMYAPVASRFRTYVEDLAPYGDDGVAAAYVRTIFATPEIKAWAAGAQEQLGRGDRA